MDPLKAIMSTISSLGNAVRGALPQAYGGSTVQAPFTVPKPTPPPQTPEQKAATGVSSNWTYNPTVSPSSQGGSGLSTTNAYRNLPTNVQSQYTPPTQVTSNPVQPGGGEIKNFGAKNELVGALIDKDGWTYEHLGNDNWKAVRPTTSSGEPPKLSRDDITRALNAAGGKGAYDFLTDADIQNIYKNFEGAYGSAEDLANQIENAAREKANREYDIVKESLSGQKQEVTTLSGQQKESVTKQKELTTAEMEARKTSDIAKIEGEKETFKGEVAKTSEKLAQNWKDMSLQVQRIMRARGISESGYASAEEGKLLLDFNKGLREIATKSTEALGNFADAVVETNGFYSRQAQQLDFDTNKAMEDIDTWVRQKVADIQTQEQMALSDKLTEIKNATLQADKLRTDIAMQIAEKKTNLDMWLYQVQTQYKLAVATAAQGKVQTAADNIKQAQQVAGLTSDLLAMGVASITKEGQILIPNTWGRLITGKDEDLTLDMAAPNIGQLNQLSQAVKGYSVNNAIGLEALGGNSAMSNILQNYGVGGNVYGSTQNQNNGVISSILSRFGL